jgi:hypothetical protein
MVGWFAYGFWSLRDLWEDVYVLHNPARSEAVRVQAAYHLSRDARFNDAQRMEICLRRDVPDLARYLLAESISTDAVASDPRSFALAAARSPDWPDWLRLLLARRLAYGAFRGYAMPAVALDELANHADPMIALWANLAMAIRARDLGQTAEASLEEPSQRPGPTGELAKLLLSVIHSPAGEREARLDEITLWLRTHHPEGAKIWHGWHEAGGRLDRVAPK